MLRTILVAFDGSDQSDKAFDLGLEIADEFNANLQVVGVIHVLPELITASSLSVYAFGAQAWPTMNWWLGGLEAEGTGRRVTFDSIFGQSLRRIIVGASRHHS